MSLRAIGIRIGLLAPHQLPGLAAVLVGTQAPNREFLAEELGLELEILLGRPQGHGHHFFHHIDSSSVGLDLQRCMEKPDLIRFLRAGKASWVLQRFGCQEISCAAAGFFAGLSAPPGRPAAAPGESDPRKRACVM
jgi:hypothetical protein